jgi:hypothetical protein
MRPRFDELQNARAARDTATAERLEAQITTPTELAQLHQIKLHGMKAERQAAMDLVSNTTNPSATKNRLSATAVRSPTTIR